MLTFERKAKRKNARRRGEMYSRVPRAALLAVIIRSTPVQTRSEIIPTVGYTRIPTHSNGSPRTVTHTCIVCMQMRRIERESRCATATREPPMTNATGRGKGRGTVSDNKTASTVKIRPESFRVFLRSFVLHAFESRWIVMPCTRVLHHNGRP